MVKSFHKNISPYFCAKMNNTSANRDAISDVYYVLMWNHWILCVDKRDMASILKRIRHQSYI